MLLHVHHDVEAGPHCTRCRPHAAKKIPRVQQHRTGWEPAAVIQIVGNQTGPTSKERETWLGKQPVPSRVRNNSSAHDSSGWPHAVHLTAAWPTAVEVGPHNTAPGSHRRGNLRETPPVKAASLASSSLVESVVRPASARSVASLPERQAQHSESDLCCVLLLLLFVSSCARGSSVMDIASMSGRNGVGVAETPSAPLVASPAMGRSRGMFWRRLTRRRGSGSGLSLTTTTRPRPAKRSGVDEVG